MQPLSQAHSQNPGEQQYLDLLSLILQTGTLTPNRTQTPALTLPGASLTFQLQDQYGNNTFPAITTKKLAFTAVKGELLAFMEGSTKLSRFKELGAHIWDANQQSPAWQNNPHNIDPTDSLGRIYGAQWRNWTAKSHLDSIDQLAQALHLIRTDPTNRRIIVNAWNAAELDQACLPPCHVLFQFLPNPTTKTLNLCMYQRSCDMFLGVPFNIASYALLTNLFAAWCGYKPGQLTMFLADAHIYENHIEQVQLQLMRQPYFPPALSIPLPFNATTIDLDTLLDDLKPDDIQLRGYSHHEAIKAPMAV